MIGMTLAGALFGYLALWILFIAILWCRELMRVKNHAWNLSNSTLFHCDDSRH